MPTNSGHTAKPSIQNSPIDTFIQKYQGIKIFKTLNYFISYDKANANIKTYYGLDYNP